MCNRVETVNIFLILSHSLHLLQHRLCRWYDVVCRCIVLPQSIRQSFGVVQKLLNCQRHCNYNFRRIVLPNNVIQNVCWRNITRTPRLIFTWYCVSYFFWLERQKICQNFAQFGSIVDHCGLETSLPDCVHIFKDNYYITWKVC